MRTTDEPIGPDEAAALRAVLPLLVYEPEAAARSEVERMVAKASLAYPNARLSDREAAVRLEVYADALADLPADVLGMAFLEAVRTIRFFPSVAELRALADKELGRRRWKRWKAEHLIAVHERDWRPPQMEIGDEERAEVKRLLGGLAKRLSASDGRKGSERE